MKHLSFALAIVASICMVTDSIAFFKVGLKGGVNLANVTVTDTDLDYKLKPGLMVGAFGEIPLSPSGQLGVRGDLLYVQKGTKYELSVGGTSPKDVKWNMDELVLAPFLLFRFPVPRLNPFLQAGPEFGYNTLAQTKVDGDKVNVGPSWKSGNLSLNVGTGASVPLGVNDLTVDVRYNLGLSDMNDGLGLSGTKIKTNGVQLLIGLALLRI